MTSLFVLDVMDLEDKKANRTVCTQEELSNLLANLDTKYQVMNVAGIHNIVNWQTFLKPVAPLETGV